MGLLVCGGLVVTPGFVLGVTDLDFGFVDFGVKMGFGVSEVLWPANWC